MIILDLLEASGTDLHKVSGRANEYTLCCPFCADRGESQDYRFRLGINAGTGFGQCFNCSWKSRSITNTAHELCRIWGLRYSMRASAEIIEKEAAELLPEIPQLTSLPEEYETFSSDYGSDPIETKALKYLCVDRGITEAQIKKHKIGFCASGKYSWRIVFPIIDLDKKIYGYCTRDFSGKQTPKYLNSPGIKMLWGANKSGETAIVVEGIVDALKVENAVTDSETVVLAKLGSSVTDAQIEQLRRYKKIVIFPDWDKPGVAGATEFANKCVEEKLDTFIVIPQKMNDLDPGSMSKQQIVEYLSATVPWNSSNEIRMKVAALKR